MKFSISNKTIPRNLKFRTKQEKLQHTKDSISQIMKALPELHEIKNASNTLHWKYRVLLVPAQLKKQCCIISPIIESVYLLDYPVLVKGRCVLVLSEFLNHNTDSAFNCEARRYMQEF